MRAFRGCDDYFSRHLMVAAHALPTQCTSEGCSQLPAKDPKPEGSVTLQFEQLSKCKQWPLMMGTFSSQRASLSQALNHFLHSFWFVSFSLARMRRVRCSAMLLRSLAARLANPKLRWNNGYQLVLVSSPSLQTYRCAPVS